jgi:flagellar motor switch/type III secretory pathway protein FliN
MSALLDAQALVRASAGNSSPSGAAPEGLRALRLERLSAPSVALANRFFGAAAQSIVELPQGRLLWRWRPAAPSDFENAAVVLILGSGSAHCVLALERNHGPGLDERIDLDAFDGAALQLAAALRFAAIVAHLERLCGERFDEVHLQRGSTAPLPHALRVGFTLGDDAGAPSHGLRGCLQIAPGQFAMWQRLRGSTAPLPPAAAQWPAVLQLWLAQRLAVSPAALKRLRTGGALLLGAVRPDGLSCFLKSDNAARTWSCRLAGERLHLLDHRTDVAGPDPFATPKLPMNTTSAHEPSPAPDLSKNLIDGLPITLEFHLGRVTLPLSELPAALAAGHVIELGRRLDNSAVTVRANGQALAVGELLQVGDQLAVRISRVVGALGEAEVP